MLKHSFAAMLKLYHYKIYNLLINEINLYSLIYLFHLIWEFLIKI